MGALASPETIRKLKSGLLVSCQAPKGSPLDHPRIIAALAKAAEQHGAVGVRINGPANIRAVRSAVNIPVIGIEKLRRGSSPVYITPTLASGRRVVRAGAGIVALDCTARRRPNGERLERIIAELKRRSHVLIMADVSTVEEGVAAAGMGVDLVATTLHGYTENTHPHHRPAFGLLRKLAQKLRVPVILEGRVRTPEDLRKGFDLGAYAVVVGTAITDVEWLVRMFVEATPRAKHHLPGRLQVAGRLEPEIPNACEYST
ncbi:MAG: N-acetylmannosamine-6-phosphate 2-epimerase [Terriglobia bacterium]